MRGTICAPALPSFRSGLEYGLPDFGAAMMVRQAPRDPVETARQAGYEKGFAEATAVLAAEAETARHAEAERATNAIAAARAEWCMNEAERLAALLQDATQAVEATLSRQLAGILSPFIEAELRKRMLDAFSDAVRQALGLGGRAAGPPAKIEMSGPADLLDALKAKLQSADVPIDFVAKPGPELRVRIDETCLSTNAADWLRPFTFDAHS